MQRNWYIICTLAKQEKKVIGTLQKKGIECFCPFTKKEIKNGTRTSVEYLPVFNSYVFAFITAIEIATIKKIPNIISLAHWKSKPVMLQKEEIDAIRLMSENYENIQIEKNNLNIEHKVSYVTATSSSSYSNNVVPLQPNALKVVLPNLGYTMLGERNLSNAMGPNKKFSLSTLFF
jgi:transcription antitermination factor NusG